MKRSLLKKLCVRLLITVIVFSLSQLVSTGPKITSAGKLSVSAAARDDNKIGLLLVLSRLGSHRNNENYYAPRSRTEDLRTIWLTADDFAVNSAEKRGFAVVPGHDGFYRTEQIHGELISEKPGKTIEINKIITYKIGNDHKSQVDVKDEKYLVYSSEGFHLEFAGSKYLSLLHMWVYTSGAGGYQYRPSIRFCKLGHSLPAHLEDTDEDSGLVPIKEILPPELHATIDSQIQAYKNELDANVKKESDRDTQYISEADLTLRRANGRWRLMVPLKFSNWKYSHNYFVSFHEIDCPLPKDLVGHDELCIPFAEIKKLIPDAKDAVSSPDNWMLVVQTSDSLRVYINPLKEIDKPVYIVPIDSGEKIILNQWSQGEALAKWDEELSRMLN